MLLEFVQPIAKLFEVPKVALDSEVISF